MASLAAWAARLSVACRAAEHPRARVAALMNHAPGPDFPSVAALLPRPPLPLLLVPPLVRTNCTSSRDH
jgi:hypothetical protein